MKALMRILTLVLVCIMFCGTVYAEDSANAQASVTGEQAFQTLESYELVDYSLYSNVLVNREDCVTAIMKIIGMTSEIAKKCDDTIIFNDISNPYISVAHLECVAFGEGNGTYPYFYPYRDVTVKEAAAFIVRCLAPVGNVDDKINSVSASVDDTFTKAKEIGIIQATDTFYSNGDATVTPDEFYIMLYRMLYQPRYLVCDGPTSNTISNGSDKYIDCLTKVEHGYT